MGESAFDDGKIENILRDRAQLRKCAGKTGAGYSLRSTGMSVALIEDPTYRLLWGENGCQGAVRNVIAK